MRTWIAVLITVFVICPIPLVVEVTYSGEQYAEQQAARLPIVLAQNASETRFVACPAQTATVGVYRISPDDWSQPRRSATLQDTAILVVAGRKTLQCIYRTSGHQRDSFVAGEFSILREFPPGMSSCTPAEGGFRCQ
jgi:hypothetical protein